MCSIYGSEILVDIFYSFYFFWVPSESVAELLWLDYVRRPCHLNMVYYRPPPTNYTENDGDHNDWVHWLYPLCGIVVSFVIVVSLILRKLLCYPNHDPTSRNCIKLPCKMFFSFNFIYLLKVAFYVYYSLWNKRIFIIFHNYILFLPS